MIFRPGMIAVIEKTMLSGPRPQGIRDKWWHKIKEAERIPPWVVIIRSQVLFASPAYRVVAGINHEISGKKFASDAFISWVSDAKFIRIADDNVWEHRFKDIESAEEGLKIYNQVRPKELQYDLRRATGQYRNRRSARNKDCKRTCRTHACKTPCRKIPKPEVGISAPGAEEEPA